jgi:FHS family Na+ dependent glucose MFS transporter 1
MIGIGKGISWAYWILGFLVFPAALFTVRMPSPPPQIHDMEGPIKPARPLLIFLAATFFFLYVGAEVAFGGWLYTYAISLNLGSATTAAYYTSAFWGAFTAGRLLSIPIAAKLHPRTILIVDLLGCLASLLLPLIFPGSSTFLWICTIGTGLFMASIFPTMLNLAQSYMTMTGRITSWFFVGASVGGMILPWFIGQLFEPVGPQVVIVVITAFMLIAGVVLGTITAWVARASSPTPSGETGEMQP